MTHVAYQNHTYKRQGCFYRRLGFNVNPDSDIPRILRWLDEGRYKSYFADDVFYELSKDGVMVGIGGLT